VQRLGGGYAINDAGQITGYGWTADDFNTRHGLVLPPIRNHGRSRGVCAQIARLRKRKLMETVSDLIAKLVAERANELGLPLIVVMCGRNGYASVIRYTADGPEILLRNVEDPEGQFPITIVFIGAARAQTLYLSKRDEIANRVN
jgi:hypothetical protein